MNLAHKIKSLERTIVFMRWGACAEFGKIKYVGSDFVEFDIIDGEDMEYIETIIINNSLILEIIVKSPDISRVIAGISMRLPVVNK